MNQIVNKVRNLTESNRRIQTWENAIAKNQVYRKIIMAKTNKKIEEIRRTRKYIFALEVSSYCNARCIFCPNVSMKRKKSIMTMEIFNKIVERIKNEGITPTQFNLTGTGEPLMDKKLFEKVEILKITFPESTVFFPTNLCLANNRILNQIVDSKLDNVGISLNANNASEYKKIMNLDYDKTIKNIEQLIKLRDKKNKSLKIFLTVAANPINRKSLSLFTKKWENKVDGIAINWIHDWAGAVKNTSKKNLLMPRYPCRLLFEQIVVQSNGNIPLCCIDYEGLVVGGNVMKNKIIDSYYSKKMEIIRMMHLSNKIDEVAMCNQCRFSERGLYWLA